MDRTSGITNLDILAVRRAAFAAEMAKLNTEIESLRAAVVPAKRLI